MCTTSMIMDTGRQYFTPVLNQPPAWFTRDRTDEVLAAIDALRKAFEAAKVFDTATNQPNCEDPEKVRLMDRIDELEKRLKALEVG